MELSFCPISTPDTFSIIKDPHLFSRKLTYKFLFDHDRQEKQKNLIEQEIWKDFTVAEFRALKDLVLLLEENDTDPTQMVGSEYFDTIGQHTQTKLYQQELTSLGNAVKPKSTHFPSLRRNPNVWTFLTQVTKKIELLVSKKLGNQNLSQAHRNALVGLSSNSQLVIKPSDKGGNVVLLDELQYRNMCWDILKNRQWYKPISASNIAKYNLEYEHIIHSAHAEGLIINKIFEGIQVPHPKTQTFYALPKTHKNLCNPPGQPIVSGVGSITERASKLVDEYLRPHVVTLPSYIKDTTDLLKNLDSLIVPTDCLLVAIDIEALYSSIPHNLGVETISKFLDECGPKCI